MTELLSSHDLLHSPSLTARMLAQHRSKQTSIQILHKRFQNS